MEIIKIHTLDQLKEYEGAWRRLEEIDEQLTFYQVFDYNFNWCKYNLTDQQRLNIYLVVHNQEVVALAPFYLEERKKAFLSWTELKFIGMGDYRTILCDNRQVNRDTLYNLILQELLEEDGVDRILLSYISQDNDFSHYLRSSEKYNKFTNYLTENPLINLHEKEKITPKKARKKKNRLARDLNYKFIVENQISDQLFEEISQLHQSQQEFMREELNRLERRSHFKEEAKNDFIRQISKLEDRSLVFLIRDQAGQLIFYRYCYVHQGTLYSWNSSYNFRYHAHNLGDAALLEMIEYLEESKKYDELDLGAGAYAWKFRWTKESRVLYQFDYWKEKHSLAYKMNRWKGLISG